MYPLIILSPPRSFSSVTAAMLGQHPQMYGLPELNLFAGENLEELIQYFESDGHRAGRRWDGLLRAIAELFMGKQTRGTISLARKWVLKHSEETTVGIFEKIMDRAAPRIVVEKSITTVWNDEMLGRALNAFPDTRFIHLTRHPRSHGASMMELMKKRGWEIARGIYDHSTNPPTPDPQLLWYRVNSRIVDALSSIPDDRKMQLRGEDLLHDPEQKLAEIAEWMGLRTDSKAIEEMQHPERSPFASIGPNNAPMGSDHKFLEDPVLKPYTVKDVSLEGKLPWRNDINGFFPEVNDLAVRLGYS